jgi:uncharacterized protein (TIGR02001 family)
VEMKIAQKMALAALALSGAAFAQTKAPEPDYTLSYNIGVVTDYRYRGISQSRLKPALQGGVDFAHKSGFYVGAWASSIKWIKDTGTIAGFDAGSANVEIDLYGGYKGELPAGFSYDVGALQYWYPRNKLGDAPLGALKNANTTELYGALTYGPGTLKYSHAVSNTFGNPDSKNSGYWDLTVNLEGPWGVTITPHIGHQRIQGPYKGVASYTDYSLTLSKEVIPGLSASLGYVGTDAEDTWYISPSGKFLGKHAAVAGLKYSF